LFGNAVRSGNYAVNDLFAKVEVPASETTLRSLFELDAEIRFLVDPTIGWRRHEWRFRVEERTRSRGRERTSPWERFRRGEAR